MMEETAAESKPLVIDIHRLVPGITEEVTAQIREKALASFGYIVNEAVALEVRKYIAAYVVPDIQEELRARGPEIRAAIVAGVVAAMEAVGERVKKSAIEKMSGWQGDSIVGQVLGHMFPRSDVP